MEEADIVSTKHRCNEGCNVGFAYDLLLLGLKEVDGICVNEWRSSCVDFTSLVEETLDGAVCLATFIFAAAHEFLQLGE